MVAVQAAQRLIVGRSSGHMKSAYPHPEHGHCQEEGRRLFGLTFIFNYEARGGLSTGVRGERNPD